MIEKQVHLTFKTSEEISIKLKCAAQAMNMTQPELINMICTHFIKTLDSKIENDPPL